MTRLLLIALAPLALAGPAAAAQAMDPSMPGKMPTPKTAAKTTAKAKPRPGSDTTSMPGMQTPAAGSGAAAAPAAPMPDMPGMKPSARADAATPAAAQEAPTTEPEISTGPSPPPPNDHAADRYYDPSVMAAARAQLREEHGGMTVSMVMANLAEYQARAGGGYRWDGAGWIGGNIDRLVVTSEGEGSRRDGLGAAEVQGLVSHAIGPYFDLQAGVRQDFAPRARTFATVGFRGLAPYWFDVAGALFLSIQGELLGRLESTYDLRLTQRLILQPRAELNFASQNSAGTRTGSGLSNAELGLRLRYEIAREFAPYIGVSWDRKVGKTADFARARGDDVGGASFVAGLRTFF